MVRRIAEVVRLNVWRHNKIWSSPLWRNIIAGEIILPFLTVTVNSEHMKETFVVNNSIHPHKTLMSHRMTDVGFLRWCYVVQDELIATEWPTISKRMNKLNCKQVSCFLKLFPIALISKTECTQAKYSYMVVTRMCMSDIFIVNNRNDWFL